MDPVGRHILNDPSTVWEFEKGGGAKSEEQQRIDRLKDALYEAGGQRSWLDGWSASKKNGKAGGQAHWFYTDADGKIYRSIIQIITHFGFEPGQVRSGAKKEDQAYASLGHDSGIVDRRVRVFWEGDNEWYCGVVTDFDDDDDTHCVLYDDGDVQRCGTARA